MASWGEQRPVSHRTDWRSEGPDFVGGRNVRERFLVRDIVGYDDRVGVPEEAGSECPELFAACCVRLQAVSHRSSRVETVGAHDLQSDRFVAHLDLATHLTPLLAKPTEGTRGLTVSKLSGRGLSVNLSS